MPSKSSVWILFLAICYCVSCTEGSGDNTTQEPTNLLVTVAPSELDPRVLTITATADNTIRYEFTFGDNNSSEPFISSDGLLDYTYKNFGTYTIEVKAFGASGRFIRKSLQYAALSEDGVVGEGYVSPTSYSGMTLIWNDEFNGNGLDDSFWTYELGTGCPNLCGWGNNELQYYSSQNTSVSGGLLTITAKNESFQGSQYTSSRIISKDKFKFRYGRVDIRAQLPQGKGLWPALWMLGNNISSIGWPACGEIDIMELVGGEGRDHEVHGTIHWEDGGRQLQGGGFTTDDGIFADKFYVFSVLWDDNSVTFLVNDQAYKTISTSSSVMDEFRRDFFFIMNIAVGGDWPGSPDNSTVFPQTMNVDYIRVFQTL